MTGFAFRPRPAWVTHLHCADSEKTDDTLVRNDLTPAERAAHVAERKRLYEERHPETKHGATSGTNKSKAPSEVAKLATSVDRFTADTAEKTGTSERSVKRDASRGTRIKNIRDVVGTSLDKGEELDVLASLPLSQQALLIR